MNFLVNHVKDTLQGYLVQKLYKESVINESIKRSTRNCFLRKFEVENFWKFDFDILKNLKNKIEIFENLILKFKKKFVLQISRELEFYLENFQLILESRILM